MLHYQQSLDLEKNIARYNGMLFTAFNRQLELQLREQQLGISPEQFRLLSHLWKEDGVTQQNLACVLGRDRAAITRVVDILEREGLVTRIPDRQDRRVNMIYLTKKGKAIHTPAIACAEAVLQKALQGLNKQEIRQAEDVIRRITANLNK